MAGYVRNTNKKTIFIMLFALILLMAAMIMPGIKAYAAEPINVDSGYYIGEEVDPLDGTIAAGDSIVIVAIDEHGNRNLILNRGAIGGESFLVLETPKCDDYINGTKELETSMLWYVESSSVATLNDAANSGETVDVWSASLSYATLHNLAYTEIYNEVSSGSAEVVYAHNILREKGRTNNTTYNPNGALKQDDIYPYIWSFTGAESTAQYKFYKVTTSPPSLDNENSNFAELEKTASVYDYENRIYKIDLAATHEMQFMDKDLDLAFVVDVSNSMLFPSDLTETGLTLLLSDGRGSFEVRNNEPSNGEIGIYRYYTVSSGVESVRSPSNIANSVLNEKEIYFAIGDKDKSSTVYAIFKYNNVWQYVDASYYAKAQISGNYQNGKTPSPLNQATKLHTNDTAGNTTQGLFQKCPFLADKNQILQKTHFKQSLQTEEHLLSVARF